MVNGKSELRFVHITRQPLGESHQYFRQLLAGQPLWARLFYLVRTGHLREALDEAMNYQAAIEHREANFINHFRTWIESADRR